MGRRSSKKQHAGRGTTAALRVLPLLLALLFLCMQQIDARAAVAGEGMNKSLRAARADTAPALDGLLTEALWQRAPASDAFTQVFPSDGAAPSMRTTVQVAVDNKNVYFAIQAFDPEPDKISTQLSRRDSRLDSDYIEIFLDTRHDHDNGYWFRINAAGVLADGEIHDDSRINFDWDAVWRGAAQTHGEGWSAEVAIPLSILRFSQQEGQQWGFNLKRKIRRTGEITQWVYVPRNDSGTLSRAGHIEGIDAVHPRRTMELRPFSLVRMQSALDQGGSFAMGEGDNVGDYSLGLDARLGLTDGLTLDATINPDFGQVEADPVVLNLSTFENFFPEKRPFFLNGAGLWQTDIKLIHSRRIGQRTVGVGAGSSITGPDGQSQEVVSAELFAPIYGAARVSGNIGPLFRINALSAITGAELVDIRGEDGIQEVEVAPARAYQVARGKWSFGGSSYLGFVGTAVTRLDDSPVPEANHDSYAESIDGRWVRSDGMYRLYFQVASAHRHGGDEFREGDENCADPTLCIPLTREDGTIQGPGDVGYAGEFGGSKAGGAWRTFGRYRFVSPTFDVDDMGFENDWDYHSLFNVTSYQHEKPFLFFERARADLSAQTEYSFDGFRKKLRFQHSTQATTKGFWTPNYVVGYVPPGNYSTRETSDGARYEQNDQVFANAGVATDGRQPYSANTTVGVATSPGTDFRSYFVSGGLAMRPSSPLEMSVQSTLGRSFDNMRVVGCEDLAGPCWRGSEMRDYTLAQQDSSRLDLTARVSWALSTTLSLEGYMQVFAAGGHLHDYRLVQGLTGPTPTIDQDDGMALDYDGDSDGDGVRDDRFSFATLNANLVARWEMWPGSTLMAVYTRAQRHSRLADRLGYAGLRTGATQEIILLKLTLFQAN